MSPEEFIKKHITDALVGEGFPAEIARGGLNMALIIIGAVLRPAGREACSLIVFSVPGSGPLDRQHWLNVAQERSASPVRDRTVCFNRRRYVHGLCAG
ncbi:hypothetical protein AI2762V1_0575 [Enterobacter cloacae]|jgi:hypothetical protein|nr:hypothetical protein AI2762V1_0575 [Enterobacter cloacae]CAH3505894.1 hypothetical protein AI2762V1_0575 [Enterobacter cloacae]